MLGPLRRLLYGLARPQRHGRAELEGFLSSQRLAYSCAKQIARELSEGWTEGQAARLLEVCLRDHGVSVFLHRPFAWFGERTRFDGMRGWRDFLPSNRVLRAGEPAILDVAPVYRGYSSDIGYPFALGAHAGVEDGRRFLGELRAEIPRLFAERGINGGLICERIARRILDEDYAVVHHRYPGAVLGHRVHALPESWRPTTFTPFGWSATQKVLLAGVFPELLNEEHRGELGGAWAIEPHFGGCGFGVKFEEILVVDENGPRWLSPETPW